MAGFELWSGRQDMSNLFIRELKAFGEFIGTSRDMCGLGISPPQA